MMSLMKWRMVYVLGLDCGCRTSVSTDLSFEESQVFEACTRGDIESVIELLVSTPTIDINKINHHEVRVTYFRMRAWT